MDVLVRSHTDTSGSGGLAIGEYTIDRVEVPDFETQILNGDITFPLPINQWVGLNQQINEQIFRLYESDLNIIAGIPAISDVAYNATSWNANLDGASKNAIRDKFETLGSMSTQNASAVAITGGSAIFEADGFGLRDQSETYPRYIINADSQTGSKFLYLALGDVDRTLTMTANATIGGTHSGTSSGTNTGDQTSIVGITGLASQYNASVTDKDFVFGGDSPTFGGVGIGSVPAAMTVPLGVAGTSNAPTLNSATGIAEFYGNITTSLAIGSDNNSPYALWLQTRQLNPGYTGAAFPLALNPLGGNVGIGITPSYKFHIQSPSVSASPFMISASDTSDGASFSEDGSGNFEFRVFDASGTATIRLRSAATSNFSGGNVGFGTSSPTTLIDVNSDSIRVRTAKTPASASAAGAVGTFAWDADYIYICTATDTWKRSAIATW